MGYHTSMPSGPASPTPGSPGAAGQTSSRSPEEKLLKNYFISLAEFKFEQARETCVSGETSCVCGQGFSLGTSVPALTHSSGCYLVLHHWLYGSAELGWGNSRKKKELRGGEGEGRGER